MPSPSRIPLAAPVKVALSSTIRQRTRGVRVTTSSECARRIRAAALLLAGVFNRVERLASGSMTPLPQPSEKRRSLRDRLLALLLSPDGRPAGWGVAVGAAFVAAEFMRVVLLQRSAPNDALGAIFLLGVLVVSAGWTFWLGLAMSLVSAAAYGFFHVADNHNPAPALCVFLPLALLANVLAGQARVRAAEAEQRRREAEALARQQAALRRVATLVAGGAEPNE